ncbi:MAG: serine/threonine-protein kinase [bacterium]
MAAICPKCRSRFDDRLPRCPHDGRQLVADLSGLVVAGRYTLRELLGVGGMDSSVWLAMQQPVQRPVAVKLLPPTDGDSADRFARGARIASNLSHPHITVVHDYGRTEDGKLFLVMELLEGRVLHDVLRVGGMPIDRALHITDQVLKALDHAHRRNVVHRDIKPGNLFLSTRNDDPDFVKVLDFGIARFIDADDGFFDEPLQEITTTRQICGTPQYMAPEQIAMGTVDARTDLYALGIVLYRMITGELPFNSRDHRELFRAHLTQAPPPFSAVRPGLEFPELEALVMRVLAKSPDDRFASAAEMRVAIRQLRGRLGISGPEDELTPMSGAVSAPSGLLSNPGTAQLEVVRPRRDLALPLLLVVLVLLGLGAFLWFQARTPGDSGAAAATAAHPTPPPSAPPPAPGPLPPPVDAQVPDAAPPAPADAAVPPPPTLGQVIVTSNPRGHHPPGRRDPRHHAGHPPPAGRRPSPEPGPRRGHGRRGRRRRDRRAGPDPRRAADGREARAPGAAARSALPPRAPGRAPRGPAHRRAGVGGGARDEARGHHPDEAAR